MRQMLDGYRLPAATQRPNIGQHARVVERAFALLPEIGDKGFIIYAAICFHARKTTGRARPSIPCLAKLTHYGQRTVSRYIPRLVRHGLVRVITRGRCGKATEYEVTGLTLSSS